MKPYNGYELFGADAHMLSSKPIQQGSTPTFGVLFESLRAGRMQRRAVSKQTSPNRGSKVKEVATIDTTVFALRAKLFDLLADNFDKFPRPEGMTRSALQNAHKTGTYPNGENVQSARELQMLGEAAQRFQEITNNGYRITVSAILAYQNNYLRV